MSLSEKFAAATVITVLSKVICAGMVLKFGDSTLTLGTIDAAMAAALLAPVLGALHLGTYVNSKKGPSDDKT